MSPGWHLCLWFEYPQSPAQYHPGPAPLCRPNRCGSLSSMHRLTTPPMGRAGEEGVAFASHSPQSNLLWKHFVKQTFVWPKSKPWSPRLICLSAQPLAFCPVSWLVWTGHCPRPEQIWSPATSPRYAPSYEPNVWIMMAEDGKTTAGSRPASSGTTPRPQIKPDYLSSHSLERKHFKPG